MLLDLGDSNSAYVSSEASVPFTHVFMISFPETILNRKVTIMSRSCRNASGKWEGVEFFLFKLFRVFLFVWLVFTITFF